MAARVSVSGCGVLVGLALVLAGLTAAPANAARFVASLDSEQEVVPAGSTNSPLTASADLDLTGSGADAALSMSILFPAGFDFGPITGGTTPTEDNDVTGLHIHNAVRGANGAVVFGILSPNSDLDGDTTVVDNGDGSTTVTSEWDVGEGNGGADLADFLAVLAATAPGEDTPLYLNLHIVSDGAGVIRGQISAVPAPAALPLFAAAIAGLLGAGLRRRQGTRATRDFEVT